MARGLPKTRSTKACDPPSMRNTIAHSFLERERKALPSRRERESDSSLLRVRGRMGEHSQAYRCVCVCACMSIPCPMCEYGEEGEAQALHESLE